MSESLLFRRLLIESLCSTPINKWGFFYPFDTAVWRLIEQARPGALGALNASFDSEPVFRGKGAKWFCEQLGNDAEYLNKEEEFMYWLVEKLPQSAQVRGFPQPSELPDFNDRRLQSIVSTVLNCVDQALEQGII